MTQPTVEQMTPLEQMIRWLEPFDFNGQVILPELTIERAAIIRAALTAQAGSGWKPIETAPRDGSCFLAIGEITEQGASYLSIKTDRPFSCRWAPSFSPLYGDVKEGFYAEGYDARCHPTHWMPLPQPPAHAAAKGE